MEYQDEIDEKLANVLASCYRMLDFSKTGGRYAYDFFASKILTAGHAPGFGESLDVLGKKCALHAFKDGAYITATAFEFNPEDAGILVQNQEEVLRRMRERSNYLAILAKCIVDSEKKMKGNKSLEEF